MITKFIKGNKLYQNILELTTGSLINNVLMIIFTPFLARLYTPTDFGLYSIFISFLTIIAIFSTGRYEFAIALPKSKLSAFSILQGIIILSVIFSILITLIISIVYYFNLFNYQAFDSQFVFLFPVTIFFSALLSGLTYFLYREHKYRLISLNAIFQGGIIIFSNFIFFYSNVKNGLILSFIIGQFFSILFLTRSIKFNFFYFNMRLIKKSLNQFIDFPKYNLFSDFLSILSQQFLPVLLSVFYNQTIVGGFSMANRLLRLPSVVVISAISNIFRNEVIKIVRSNEKSNLLYIYTLKRLILISAPIFLIILFSAKQLFVFFFRIKLGFCW